MEISMCFFFQYFKDVAPFLLLRKSVIQEAKYTLGEKNAPREDIRFLLILKALRSVSILVVSAVHFETKTQ
jgi:hypothetical protein